MRQFPSLTLTRIPTSCVAATSSKRSQLSRDTGVSPAGQRSVIPRNIAATTAGSSSHAHATSSNICEGLGGALGMPTTSSGRGMALKCGFVDVFKTLRTSRLGACGWDPSGFRTLSRLSKESSWPAGAQVLEEFLARIMQG